MLTQSFIFETPDIQIPELTFEPSLFLLFSSWPLETVENTCKSWRSLYPSAIWLGCSTAGEIAESEVKDVSLVVLAVKIEVGKIQATYHSMSSGKSAEIGELIGKSLWNPELKHILVLSEGLQVNGTELAEGIRKILGNSISVTGGLAGDGNKFEKTWVLNSEGIPQLGIVSALGFYGENWEFGFGSKGGWDSFGLERRVTYSEGNVVYEIDNEPALKLYKSYLGERSIELPASGLLFPLSMRSHINSPSVVRTILQVNESQQSLTFAGDIPQGSWVRLMKANNNRLIQGAEGAAIIAQSQINEEPDICLMVSCVGRKLVLKQMVEEEVETVQSILKAKNSIGFYSYGELAPFSKGLFCELHNQTMTITTIREKC